MAEFIETTLMDGFADGPHVTEVQIGLANQAVIGPDDYVLEGGRESEAQVLTNNSIRIFDAVYCIQGRRDVIPASGYTDVTIANGTQGMNRNDIIVRRYRKNESSEIESTEYAVIKGTPNAGAAVDPEVTTGDIRSGATLHEMALYRVKITGLNITAVEPMFNILKNMASLQKEFAELNSKMMADVQFKPFSITGNPSGGNSLVITSLTNLKKIFGDAVTTMNSGAVVMNGDGGATDAHFQNATWQNNRLYATFSSSMNKNIRVTGLIYYAPGTVLDNGTF